MYKSKTIECNEIKFSFRSINIITLARITLHEKFARTYVYSIGTFFISKNSCIRFIAYNYETIYTYFFNAFTLFMGGGNGN